MKKDESIFQDVLQTPTWRAQWYDGVWSIYQKNDNAYLFWMKIVGPRDATIDYIQSEIDGIEYSDEDE